jgi:hypothetical protein
MTAKEQLVYFHELRERYPRWSGHFISGYVHGALDEGRRTDPESSYVARTRQADPYADGYLLGFAMHRGTDAEKESWFGAVARLEDLR